MLCSKSEIRALVKAGRAGLDPAWIRAASLAAQRRVIELPEFRDAKVVGCYMATAVEVGTDALVEQCDRTGKTVCVPAMDLGSGRYNLALMREGAALVAGSMGIREPAGRDWIPLDEVDCMVVPGLGFDPLGGRIGYGAGNYDRILGPVRGSAGCFKVGLAFGFQVFERVPTGANDVMMDAIVTEEQVLRV